MISDILKTLQENTIAHYSAHKDDDLFYLSGEYQKQQKIFREVAEVLILKELKEHEKNRR